MLKLVLVLSVLTFTWCAEEAAAGATAGATEGAAAGATAEGASVEAEAVAKAAEEASEETAEEACKYSYKFKTYPVLIPNGSVSEFSIRLSQQQFYHFSIGEQKH